MKLEPAIVAPWPAVEADHERAVIEQRGKLDELPFAVGQAERRQNLSDRWHLIAGLDIVGDAGNEPIVGRLELGKQLAQLAEIELEPLGQRGFETVGLRKRFRERLVDGFRLVQRRLRGQRDMGSMCIVLKQCLGRLIVTNGADFGHLSAEATARKSEI